MRILILKMGTAHPEVVARRGDYEHWFARALARHPRRARFDLLVHPAWGNPPDADCVVVGGSRHSVYEDLPWLVPAAAYLEHMVAAGKIVLGVCFGHQLLATIFGGVVTRNRAGLIMGRREVTLTAAGVKDPLFQGMPERFPVEETHGDIVSEPPAGATRLVVSAHDPNHGFRLAETVWTVQFHPEMGPPEARAVAETQGVAPEIQPPPGAAPDSSSVPIGAGTRILWRLVDLALS